MSYDSLVRRLKSQVADGSASVSLVREAIYAAAEMGRLPVDLSGILMSLFPATAPKVRAEAVVEAADDEEDLDEPTLPYASRVGSGFHSAADLRPGGEDGQAGVAGRPGQAFEQLLPKAEPAHAAAAPPTMSTPVPGLLLQPFPAAPVSSSLSAPAAPSRGLPGLPPMPPVGPDAAPQAALPRYDDIQAKVDDVVLSALISEFQGLRQARNDASGGGRGAGRPDALDGLLVNYRSARFRSEARRAARGAASDGLKLGKLDDFAGKRAGPGSILRDRFILDAEIGRGGMGIVYSAVDRRRLEAGSGQPYVALKMLNDEFRTNSDALRVLEAEARKAQSLAHPNIATVYDFDRDKSEIFIVMELLSGKPLSRMLGASFGGAMPGHRIAATLKGICAGLSYAHEQGVVHSDLKPGNVFVTDLNTVKLLDFGLATAGTAGGFDVVSLNALTAAYASPEMFENAPRDPRDDIFALGCIAYQLLTGVHPFAMKAANEAAAQGLEPDPIPDVDPAAWAVIRQALSFDREARTGSVDDFVRGLFED